MHAHTQTRYDGWYIHVVLSSSSSKTHIINVYILEGDNWQPLFVVMAKYVWACVVASICNGNLGKTESQIFILPLSLIFTLLGIQLEKESWRLKFFLFFFLVFFFLRSYPAGYSLGRVFIRGWLRFTQFSAKNHHQQRIWKENQQRIRKRKKKIVIFGIFLLQPCDKYGLSF